MQEIRDTIRAFITEEFATKHAGALADDTPLIEREIMDSTGILMVIGFLEDEYDIFIDADDVNVEHFRTVASISDLVLNKQAEGG